MVTMLLLDEYAEFSITSFKSGIPCAGPELGWSCRMCVRALGHGAGVLLIPYWEHWWAPVPSGGTVPSRAEIPGAQVIIFQQIRAEEGSGSGQVCLQASLVLGVCK